MIIHFVDYELVRLHCRLHTYTFNAPMRAPLAKSALPVSKCDLPGSYKGQVAIEISKTAIFSAGAGRRDDLDCHRRHRKLLCVATS